MRINWWVRMLWLFLAVLMVSATWLFVPNLKAKGLQDNLQDSLEDCRLLRTNRDGTRLFLCPPAATPQPTTEPTSQPTAGATATPAQTTPGAPTATGAAPTAAAPTATAPSGAVAPYPDAPLCPSHDPRAYHSLWDSARGCHYDHHHGDDPHSADDVFGTDLYRIMGGEISYPWMTYSDAGLENDLKHAGYFWHVRRDMPCDESPCITAFRLLVHQHPTGRDATVRYHSYVIEYATSDGGYALFSGWADFGDLHSPEGTIIVDVPDNHDSHACNGAGRHKQHAPRGSTRNDMVWYGASQQVVGECHPRGFVTVSVTVHDPWDYTSQTDPAAFDDYKCYGLIEPGRCRENATTLRPHLISLNMVSMWNGLIDADGDGIVNWQGNADRYGRLLPAPCDTLGVDCAPVIFRGLRAGQLYGAADSHTASSFRDYDIYFDRRSAGWNQPVP